jgi:hypothetical protein
MLFRKAVVEDHKIIITIALKAYEKYVERMGKEPAPMRPLFKKKMWSLYVKIINK